MFLQQPGLVVKTPSSYGGGVVDETVEQGTWVNADPMKGRLVCNIGESKRSGASPRVWRRCADASVIGNSVGGLVEWAV